MNPFSKHKSLSGLFSELSVAGWVKEQLRVLQKDRPVLKVLMYPAAEQNPFLVVTRDCLELEGVHVTMLNSLDSSKLIKLAPQYDILHIYNISGYTSPFTSQDRVSQIKELGKLSSNLWIAKRLGLKIFLTLYNDPKGNYASDLLERFSRKWMFHLTDRIIAPSIVTRRMLRERYPDLPNGKLVHLPHHDFGKYYLKQVRRKQAREHLKIKTKGRVFICFGGIHPYKGLTDIIPLFGKHPLKDHTLIIAGSPSNKHYAATIEGLCANCDNIHTFLRFIPPDEVQYYLQAADIFVMPYKDVLNSDSTMLALSFGKPVVAPKVGMIPEVTNPACSVLFEHAGANKLKRALTKSLELNLESASAEARHVANSYAADKLTRRLINTYLDLFPKRDKIEEEAEEI